jgi:hypothetical protein
MEKHSRFLFFFFFAAKKVRAAAPLFQTSRPRNPNHCRLKTARFATTAQFQIPISDLFS